MKKGILIEMRSELATSIHLNKINQKTTHYVTIGMYC